MRSCAQAFTYCIELREAVLLDHMRFGPKTMARFVLFIRFTSDLLATCEEE
jgi:hypothetical protein